MKSICRRMFDQMKTRSFAILFICILATGVFVFMFGDPKPTFHEIVSKTHRQLSQLKVPVVKEPKEPGVEQQYLKLLGFTSHPRLYPTQVWSNVTLPVVATAVNSGQSQMALEFLKSLQHFIPERHLVIYDLGLDPTEYLTVARQCNSSNCTLRKFDYEKYPSHIANTKWSGHRPIIMQQVLDQAGALLWLDVRYQIISGQIKELLEKAERTGLVSWALTEPTSSLTHPRMYEYFQTQKDSYYFHRMIEPSHLLIYNLPKVHSELMLPWVQCALTSECIAPIGAQSSGCRFDKKPYYRYSGCHRYDMSALNVALGKMFDFRADSYVAGEKDKFFKETLLDWEEGEEKNNATQGSEAQTNHSGE